MPRKKIETQAENPEFPTKELAIQSALSATSIRGNWLHIYCPRIGNIIINAMYKLIRKSGLPTNDDITGVLKQIGDTYIIKGSIRDIMDDNDYRYDDAYAVLNNIIKVPPYIIWGNKKRAQYLPLMSAFTLDAENKTYEIIANPLFVKACLDCKHGYTILDIALFKKFKNKRTQILYQIIQSNDDVTIRRTVEWLKEHLFINESYKVGDYITKIFDPINDDLRQAGSKFAISCKSVYNWDEKSGQQKITAFDFRKIPLADAKPSRLAVKSLLAEGGLKKSTIAIIRACGFTDVQIQRNSLIFLACTQCMTEDFFAQSLKNWNSIEGLKNPKGYVIQQLKKSFTSFTRINPTISNLYDYCLKKGVNPDLLPKIARPASEVEAPDTPQDKSADHTGADAPTCAPKLTLDELKALLIAKGMDGEEVRLFSKTIEKWLELEQGEIEAKINRWSSTYGRITIRQIEDEVERLKHK